MVFSTDKSISGPHFANCWFQSSNGQGALVGLAKRMSLGGVSAAVLTLFSFAGPAQAQTQPTFNCAPGFYEVISGQFAILNPATGIYDNIGAPFTDEYNGIGYNVNDDYVYGFSTDGATENHLLRVGSDGSVVSLGDVGINSSRGVFDQTNRLFYARQGNGLDYIDVSTLTTGTLNFTLVPGSPNPQTGFDYAYSVVAGDEYITTLRNRNLSIYNLTDLTVRRVTVAGLPTSGNYGASWGASDGNVYFANNATGTIYAIANIDGTPTVENSFPAAQSTEHDGASCPNAAPAVSVPPSVNADLSILKTNTPGVNGDVDQAADTVTSGSSTTYTLTVTNNGPDSANGAVVTDVINSGLSCTGTDAVTITGDGVPAGSFTIADLTGTGIALGTLNDGQSATLTYSCEVN